MGIKKTNFLVIFWLTLLAFEVHPAPIPTTSSSSFLNADKGFFWSRYGFSIHAGETSWQPASVSSHKSIGALYVAPRSENGVQPILSVRVDRLKKKTTLKKYVHRWKKDYPRLGFNILLAKEVNVSQKNIFLLDMVNMSKDRQLRQYILLRNKYAVVITCLSHTVSFHSIVDSCNRIVKNFTWSPM